MAKIIVQSEDPVAKAMSGPAIRCWEFAKALSKCHEVVLVSPNQTDLTHESFQIIHKHDSSYQKILGSGDVLITHYLSPRLAYQCKKNGVKIIFDAYCPLVLEVLETYRDAPKKIQSAIFTHKQNELLRAFKWADRIICASEKQRDLWLGFLLTFNHLKEQYAQGSTLRHFIDVVPFGLNSQELPTKNDVGPREIFNLRPIDKIIIWGGSLSNWFDPCTLIESIHLIAQQRKDIKLVFLGVNHPNSNVPEMSVANEAISLAKELGIYQKDVFFNYQWTPYEKRHNFLAESTIGISIHSEHLETRFSFRTRILDYLWAGLPIISTEGDSFAELIQMHQLGAVVPYKNPSKLAEEILFIVDNEERLDLYRQNCLKIKSQFYWEEIIAPINRMIDQLISPINQSTKLKFNDLFSIGMGLFGNFKTNFQMHGFKTALSKTLLFLRKKKS